MTTQCGHERLVLVDLRSSMCAACKAVIEVGDGLCPRCRRPLDDTSHHLAAVCA